MSFHCILFTRSIALLCVEWREVKAHPFVFVLKRWGILSKHWRQGLHQGTLTEKDPSVLLTSKYISNLDDDKLKLTGQNLGSML